MTRSNQIRDQSPSEVQWPKELWAWAGSGGWHGKRQGMPPTATTDRAEPLQAALVFSSVGLAVYTQVNYKNGFSS